MLEGRLVIRWDEPYQFQSELLQSGPLIGGVSHADISQARCISDGMRCNKLASELSADRQLVARPSIAVFDASNRDPLHLVERDLIAGTVIEFGGARTFMRGHGLGVLKSTASFQIGGDARGAEGMAADPGALGRVGPSRRQSDAGDKGASLRHQQGNFSGWQISLTVAYSVIFLTTGQEQYGNRIKILTAKDAKYGFGRLIDLARAEPVAVAGKEAVASMFWPVAG
jgi:hypothetical protein